MSCSLDGLPPKSPSLAKSGKKAINSDSVSQVTRRENGCSQRSHSGTTFILDRSKNDLLVRVQDPLSIPLNEFPVNNDIERFRKRYLITKDSFQSGLLQKELVPEEYRSWSRPP